MNISRRAWFGAGVISGFGALLLVTVAMHLTLPPTFHSERIEWVEFDDVADAGCPGDQISFRTAIRIIGMEGGGTLWISRTFRRANDNAEVEALKNDPRVIDLLSQYRSELIGDTAVPQINGAMLLVNIVPGGERRMAIDLDSEFTIPELPPGKYERVLIAGQVYVHTIHAVNVHPFTVLDTCE